MEDSEVRVAFLESIGAQWETHGHVVTNMRFWLRGLQSISTRRSREGVTVDVDGTEISKSGLRAPPFIPFVCAPAADEKESMRREKNTKERGQFSIHQGKCYFN